MVKEADTEIRVHSESLITVAPFSSNKIVIIGTAERGNVAVSGSTMIMRSSQLEAYGDYSSLEKDFGTYDRRTGQTELSLMRGADMLFAGGANYIYPVRIAASTLSLGHLYVKQSTEYGTGNVLKVCAADTGGYSKNITFKVENSLSTPLQVQEVFYTDGTTTGWDLKYFPTIKSTAGASGAPYTGNTYTKVEICTMLDESGNRALEGGIPDWINGTGLSVTPVDITLAGKYTNFVGNQQKPFISLDTGDRQVIICYDSGTTIPTSSLRGNTAAIFISSADTGQYIFKNDGQAIRVTYYYDAKDATISWQNRTEKFQNLGHANDFIAKINSGSSIVYVRSSTGSDYMVCDSGTYTQPTNMGFTALGVGACGNTFAFNTVKAALDLVADLEYDILVLPGAYEERIHNYVITRFNNDEKDNYEHTAVLGWQTGQTLGDIIGHMKTTRDDRAVFVSNEITYTNRYVTDPNQTGIETGDSSYAACIVAANIAKRSVSESILGKRMDGIEGLATEYTKPNRERLLDEGVITIVKANGQYEANMGQTSSITTDFQDITTRRIVDFCRKGLRSIGRQFKGQKNNSRVRAVMQIRATGFLAGMYNDEHLRDYSTVTVTATTQEQIDGQVRMRCTVKPVFAIKYSIIDINLE